MLLYYYEKKGILVLLLLIVAFIVIPRQIKHKKNGCLFASNSPFNSRFYPDDLPCRARTD